MMDDMESRNVIKFLSHYKKQRISEFDEFGDVIVPGKRGHSNGVFGVSVVYRLAPIVILSEPTIDTETIEQIAADSNHD